MSSWHSAWHSNDEEVVDSSPLSLCVCVCVYVCAGHTPAALFYEHNLLQQLGHVSVRNACQHTRYAHILRLLILPLPVSLPPVPAHPHQNTQW